MQRSPSCIDPMQLVAGYVAYSVFHCELMQRQCRKGVQDLHWKALPLSILEQNPTCSDTVCNSCGKYYVDCLSMFCSLTCLKILL